MKVELYHKHTYQLHKECLLCSNAVVYYKPNQGLYYGFKKPHWVRAEALLISVRPCILDKDIALHRPVPKCIPSILYFFDPDSSDHYVIPESQCVVSGIDCSKSLTMEVLWGFLFFPEVNGWLKRRGNCPCSCYICVIFIYLPKTQVYSTCTLQKCMLIPCNST